MPVAYYFDVHVSAAICEQLRIRDVDVLTAQEDQADTFLDELILERATRLGRVVVTHDNGFRAMAEDWHAKGVGSRDFALAANRVARSETMFAIWN